MIGNSQGANDSASAPPQRLSHLKGRNNLMSTLSKLEIFSPDEKENAGLAGLSRGFLTTYGGKRAASDRDAHKLLLPRKGAVGNG